MSGWFESYDLSNYLPVIPDKPGILGIPDTNSKNIFGVIKRKSFCIYVNLSVFKLEKCYLHQNGIEFHHKFNGIILVGLVQHPRAYSDITIQTFTSQVKCHIRAQCAPHW